MITRYIIRSSQEFLNELCYASFVKHQFLPKIIEEDNQPIELTDETVEMNRSMTDQSLISATYKVEPLR